MHRPLLLLVTACGEGVTGLALLLWPSLPLMLLLGVRGAGTDTLLIARVAGTALLALGLMCGLAAQDSGSRALRALLVGVLLYDLAVAVVLIYGAAGLALAGILLWPVVLAHLALAIWCALCLRTTAAVETSGTGA
ncbi:MAG: hypothetical protein KC442_17365 [Thermomicrobiales bacterium]|nr:hypothetical protein [Thermomicrobiales bacterium]